MNTLLLLQDMRNLMLIAMLAVITVTVPLAFSSMKFENIAAIRDCQREENYLYDVRWAERCELLGMKNAMCRLPKEHAEEIGWRDHLLRSQACKE